MRSKASLQEGGGGKVRKFFGYDFSDVGAFDCNQFSGLACESGDQACTRDVHAETDRKRSAFSRTNPYPKAFTEKRKPKENLPPPPIPKACQSSDDCIMLLELNCEVDGVKLRALVDSGATHSFVS